MIRQWKKTLLDGGADIFERAATIRRLSFRKDRSRVQAKTVKLAVANIVLL